MAPAPNEHPRHEDTVAPSSERAGTSVVIRHETVTRGHGVRGEEFTLSDAAEAALQIDHI